MPPILNNPEIQNIITALLTLAVAWIKRKLDLKKIKKTHQEDIFNTKVHYEGRIASLKDRIKTFEDGTKNS